MAITFFENKRKFFCLPTIIICLSFFFFILFLASSFTGDPLRIGRAYSTPINARQGEMFTVNLSGNLTTGYEWQLSSAFDGVELVESSYETSNSFSPGMVGVGGTFRFTFRALRPSQGTLRFIYVRPWEKKEEPNQEDVNVIIR